MCTKFSVGLFARGTHPPLPDPPLASGVPTVGHWRALGASARRVVRSTGGTLRQMRRLALKSIFVHEVVAKYVFAIPDPSSVASPSEPSDERAEHFGFGATWTLLLRIGGLLQASCL